jgi:hypothetical protein
MFVFCGLAEAQSNFCATHASTLYCMTPNLYGNPNPDPFSPIVSALGAQMTLVPLASPASGIVFKINPDIGKVTTAGTFGPVLTERGESIGKGKVLLAITYQRFDFSSMDGIDLNNIPVVFNICNTSGTCVQNGSSTKINLRVNQFAFFSTVGITKRFEVSVAVPISNVRISATGQATGPVVTGQPLTQFRWADGIGDVAARAKYTVIDEFPWCWCSWSEGIRGIVSNGTLFSPC